MSRAKAGKARVAAIRSCRAKYRHKRYDDNREASTRATMAAGSFESCHCGQPYPHDWPGKDTGAVHPHVSHG